MNQMRVRLENQLTLQRQNEACKVSKQRSKQIGDRLYAEHKERERR